jgi:flagellar biosynthesis protein
MNKPHNKPQRQVVLRFRSQEAGPRLAPDLGPAELEAMQATAERLGLPRHPDPQLAALLAAVRLRDDVPDDLFSAAAAVLGAVYDASADDPA